MTALEARARIKINKLLDDQYEQGLADSAAKDEITQFGFLRTAAIFRSNSGSDNCTVSQTISRSISK